MTKLWMTLLLATLTACAGAQSAPAPDAGKDNLTTASAADSRAVKAALSARNCMAATGTHIIRKDACVNAAGRSYDRSDIERTGTLNTGEALERLDPSVNTRP